MFGRKKGPSRPTAAFDHAFGCKIVVADPGFEPEWQEIEEGHWRRTCQCHAEDIYEPRADTRTRLARWTRRPSNTFRSASTGT
jgi:hypothetical protein